MFTGIIKACQEVASISKEGGILSVQIKLPNGWELEIGESINVNGVCSTVVIASQEHFVVEYMPETLKLTTIGQISHGDFVNLERSLTLTDLISGHLVSGHVDGVSEVIDVREDAGSFLITLAIPERGAKYLIHKGSVAVNGISLTVIDPTTSSFQVAIIPHTWKETNLHKLVAGDKVNLEYDIMAKYIERMQNYG
ncbi:MAG: riboflavin synthase [Candidatus Kerfeldbacteria bacterium CG15_BIG_FIL_POST_REV_8_21_14_020_45_12]|uniref:Riboflavin synthase n=1 Tax=Candidatus Kerfeldbacteria bacterium CG15_BIG_FIL_POST_REV_8_21_14_020_45_12 TaxID=2014247 RepID=A0A2M7H4D8_9BACT|nr:MAG: riboflavin synthase [Candidatus Kerfeldbacteria bacterium CG15_BIG_FIL_POST_REV_8_21_14_020_45_12]PJA93064.1 MAG: riboflavin synthase [Candidatus Kerfeldbacteria bacterium CG_4_9_14_3_um_filter_45_8]